MLAYTGISIGSSGSAHIHETELQDDHSHPVNLDPVGPHEHDVTENSVGNGTPIPYTPMHMTVFVYLRI